MEYLDVEEYGSRHLDFSTSTHTHDRAFAYISEAPYIIPNRSSTTLHHGASRNKR